MCDLCSLRWNLEMWQYIISFLVVFLWLLQGIKACLLVTWTWHADQKVIHCHVPLLSCLLKSVWPHQVNGFSVFVLPSSHSRRLFNPDLACHPFRSSTGEWNLVSSGTFLYKNIAKYGLSCLLDNGKQAVHKLHALFCKSVKVLVVSEACELLSLSSLSRTHLQQTINHCQR